MWRPGLGPPSRRGARGALLVFTAVAVTLSLAAGARHDYIHYLAQWRLTMSGGNPWDQSLSGQNPGYGPLFNALAPLAAIFSLFPKLIFVAAWVGVATMVARLFQADRDSGHLAPVVFAYFALTPYFWIEIAAYGHFDILPAAATLAAVHLALKHRVRSGTSILALGALLKTYPIVAFPFLLAARPGQWRAGVLSLAGTCAVVFALSYAIWGNSTFTAILLPVGNESDLFSIFHFAKGRYSPLRLLSDHPNLDPASFPLLVLGGGLLAALLMRRGIHVVVSVLATLIAVFALFKQGHPQFQMVVFVLAPYLLLTLPATVRSDRLILGALGTYLAWFTLLDLLYLVGGQLRQPPWVILREVLGLPTFALALTVVVVLLKLRTQPVTVPGGEAVSGPARARPVLS